jgi:hypothetical protein
MPVTKTAKRALRGSKRKESVNKMRMSKLEISIKTAKKSKSKKNIEALHRSSIVHLKKKQSTRIKLQELNHSLPSF